MIRTLVAHDGQRYLGTLAWFAPTPNVVSSSEAFATGICVTSAGMILGCYSLIFYCRSLPSSPGYSDGGNCLDLSMLPYQSFSRVLVSPAMVPAWEQSLLLRQPPTAILSSTSSYRSLTNLYLFLSRPTDVPQNPALRIVSKHNKVLFEYCGRHIRKYADFKATILLFDTQGFQSQASKGNPWTALSESVLARRALNYHAEIHA